MHLCNQRLLLLSCLKARQQTWATMVSWRQSEHPEQNITRPMLWLLPSSGVPWPNGEGMRHRALRAEREGQLALARPALEDLSLICCLVSAWCMMLKHAPRASNPWLMRITTENHRKRKRRQPRKGLEGKTGVYTLVTTCKSSEAWPDFVCVCVCVLAQAQVSRWDLCSLPLACPPACLHPSCQYRECPQNCLCLLACPTLAPPDSARLFALDVSCLHHCRSTPTCGLSVAHAGGGRNTVDHVLVARPISDLCALCSLPGRLPVQYLRCLPQTNSIHDGRLLVPRS